MIQLMLYGFLLVGAASGSVDMTMEEQATGSAVVEAVCDMISQSCLFQNDRLMLRRIAYAETQDGMASYTFDIDGAIWQVDEGNFTATQADLSADMETGIKSEFDIDWNLAQYSDLLKPLYSGIAAMLKITSYYTTPGSIPQSVSGQADYWAVRYTINTWINATATYIDASEAVAESIITSDGEVMFLLSSPKSDIVFTVDGSGSIQADNFESVKSFIIDVVDSFDIGPEKVRVGLIEFSDYAVIQFNLTAYDNKDAVKAAVLAMPYYGGGTNSADGLYVTKDMIQTQGRQEDGVPVVTIFLTDGKSNDETATVNAADEFHETLPEVTVFAIGVGSDPDMDELWTIASEPKCNHVYTLEGFDDITELTNQITDSACKAQGELNEGTEVTGSLTQDEEYYCKMIAMKNESGLRIELTATSGGVQAYYSWNVENPSEAVYDVTMEADDRQGTVSMYIPWDDDSLEGTEAPLYGTVVGAQPGQNDFAMSYKDSGIHQTAGLLSLIAAVIGLVNHLR